MCIRIRVLSLYLLPVGLLQCFHVPAIITLHLVLLWFQHKLIMDAFFTLLQLMNSDVEGGDFIVFYAAKNVFVTGNVVTDQEYLASLKVRI